MNKNFLKYGNCIGFVTVIIFNILAATGVLGGISTRDVSYMYKSLLAPADYTFSIWSIIYILLAIMCFKQFSTNDLREKLGYGFILSCLLNISWIIAWQFKAIALSFIIIFALLLILIRLMQKTRETDLWSNMAVGLYAGWINVAMLANLGALFVKHNWIMNQGKAIAATGLTIGFIWICYFIIAYSNIYYALGAFWGYLGILVASETTETTIMSIIGMVFIAGITILVKTKKRLDI